ncbi:MAG TPA: protein kinase [Bryobacteraceae bacterium]
METLGRYQILGELGRGGCGIVYRALDPSIGRMVAIKTIRAELNSSTGLEVRERFRREARSAGALSHPNIVTIHEFSDSGDPMFIAMEFIDGHTLGEYISRSGLLPVEFALEVLHSAADALDYAHSHHIVHRDVKPANFLIDKSGHLKITDFGMAKLIDSDEGLTSTGTVVGTAQYMPPEQITAAPVTGRSDQFSLAVIAYEMLTGVKPFQGNSWASLMHAIATAEPPSVTQYREILGEDVTAVLRRALSKGPSARYASCCEFRNALEHAVLGATIGRPVLAETLKMPVPLPPELVETQLLNPQTPAPVTVRARDMAPTVKKPLPLKSVAIGIVAALVVLGVWVGIRSRATPAKAPADARHSGVASPADGYRGSAAPSPPRVDSVPGAAAPAPRGSGTTAKNPAKEAALDTEKATAKATAKAEPVKSARALPSPAPPAPTPVSPPAAGTQSTPAQPAAPVLPGSTAPPAPAPPVSKRAEQDQAAPAADDQAKRLVEEQAQAKAKTEEQAKLAADDRAKRLSDDQAQTKAKADEQARLAADDRAKRLADDQAQAKAKAEEQTKNARAADFQAVSRALNAYQTAYERRDPAALQTIWPSIPKPLLDEIRSSFRDASEVSMDLRPLADPAISGNIATVNCDRILRQVILKRVLQASNRVRIVLIRNGSGWVIQSVDAVN